MRIDARVDRLRVISDLHIGNPFSQARRKLRGFIESCRVEGWDLCINGDGFEILQTSFSRLASDSADILGQLHRLGESGRRVFYVIGNHDLALEHLIENAFVAQMAPFLNITSGDARIRVEHGHLYDPFFVKHPDLYVLMTRMAGPLLHLYPDIYYVWSRYQAFKDRWTRKRARRDLEASVYYEAAERIAVRGFDAVVFGHTHNPEVVDLGDGRTYYNSGNWMQACSYVEIDQGAISLERWEGSAGLPAPATDATPALPAS